MTDKHRGIMGLGARGALGTEVRRFATVFRSQALTKASRSALSLSLCVSASPCGPPWYTFRVACLTSLDEG